MPKRSTVTWQVTKLKKTGQGHDGSPEWDPFQRSPFGGHHRFPSLCWGREVPQMQHRNCTAFLAVLRNLTPDHLYFDLRPGNRWHQNNKATPTNTTSGFPLQSPTDWAGRPVVGAIKWAATGSSHRKRSACQKTTVERRIGSRSSWKTTCVKPATIRPF